MDSLVINMITIKYRFLIPRLNDMLDMMVEALIFPENDMKIKYRQIRIHQRHKWRTKFKMRDELHE